MLIGSQTESNVPTLLTPEEKLERRRVISNRCYARTKGVCKQTRAEWLATREHNKFSPEDRLYSGWLKRNYGITLPAFYELLAKQGGLCPICGLGFESRAQTVVDHCHHKKHVRGIVHRKCNLAIGYTGENVARASQLIRYIRDECLNNLHSINSVLHEPVRVERRLLHLTAEEKQARKREQHRRAAFKWAVNNRAGRLLGPLQRTVEDKALDTYKRHLRWRYGDTFTYEDYQKLLLVQAGCCGLCGEELTEVRPPLDHCHLTGKVRGSYTTTVTR